MDVDTQVSCFVFFRFFDDPKFEVALTVEVQMSLPSDMMQVRVSFVSPPWPFHVTVMNESVAFG
jgi:hypothetical protein